MISDIGLSKSLCINSETDQSWLIKYHLFALKADNQTKLDHAADMLAQLVPRGILYRTVLMHNWYATTALVKWLLSKSKTFYPH